MDDPPSPPMVFSGAKTITLFSTWQVSTAVQLADSCYHTLVGGRGERVGHQKRREKGVEKIKKEECVRSSEANHCESNGKRSTSLKRDKTEVQESDSKRNKEVVEEGERVQQ